MITDQNNPLYGHEWRSGKVYDKYTYTVKDIARITGRSVGGIRNLMCRKKINKKNPDAVMEFLVSLLNTPNAGSEKICKYCGKTFVTRTLNQVYCSEGCVKKNNSDRYFSNRDIKLSSGKSKCAICGYNKFHGCLEWHHLDKSVKLFQLSGYASSRSDKEIEDEKKKCIVLCCNCHQEIHRGYKETINKLNILLTKPKGRIQ